MAKKEIESDFGKRIQELRKDQGYTQEKLAEKLGITQGYLSEIENERELPGRKLFAVISENLEASMDYIYSGGTKEELQEFRILNMVEWIKAQDEDFQNQILAQFELLKTYLEKKQKEKENE